MDVDQDRDDRAAPSCVGTVLEMTAAATERWHLSFAVFDLDMSLYELRRDGLRVHLEPQAFDVLAYLVRHRHRVVSKAELLDQVWGDRFVSESALTSRVKHVRRALGDDGRAQSCVRTVHGRGYRLAPGLPIAVTGADPAVGDGVSTRTGGAVPADRDVPAERTPLFGREAAVSEVVGALRTHRLVSLLGIGGAGKTRLATAVAHRCREELPDGVRFIDLGCWAGAGSVGTAVADAAGVSLVAGEVGPQLARALRARAVLFVLDNAEQVPTELAALLDHLLEHTVAPRFLVTARVPLALPDERRMPLPALGHDGPAAPAVELLVDAAARSGQSPCDPDHPAVQRICGLLGGHPLAIELAATALRLLGPVELAGRLEQGRIELLQERRPGRERHASLVAVLEGTTALLDGSDYELLGRLAGMSGSFTVDDAEQLAADLPAGVVAAAMTRLIDCSLVAAVPGRAGRFGLPGTIRLLVRHGPRAAVRMPSPVAPDDARPDLPTPPARLVEPLGAGWACAAG